MITTAARRRSGPEVRPVQSKTARKPSCRENQMWTPKRRATESTLSLVMNQMRRGGGTAVGEALQSEERDVRHTSVSVPAGRAARMLARLETAPSQQIAWDKMRAAAPGWDWRCLARAKVGRELRAELWRWKEAFEHLDVRTVFVTKIIEFAGHGNRYGETRQGKLAVRQLCGERTILAEGREEFDVVWRRACRSDCTASFSRGRYGAGGR